MISEEFSLFMVLIGEDLPQLKDPFTPRKDLQGGHAPLRGDPSIPQDLVILQGGQFILEDRAQLQGDHVPRLGHVIRQEGLVIHHDHATLLGGQFTRVDHAQPQEGHGIHQDLATRLEGMFIHDCHI